MDRNEKKQEYIKPEAKKIEHEVKAFAFTF